MPYLGAAMKARSGPSLHSINWGIRIPDDIAVVGFDDLTLAQYLHPALTTVHAPTEEVGRVAFHQLLRLLREEEVEPLTLLPTELIIRQSCGCP